MTLIPWDKSLETGIPSIDVQHQRWVSYLNEMHDAMLEGKARTVVNDILQKMTDYASSHFAAEEYMMQQAGYPVVEFEKHCAMHREFVQHMDELKAKASGVHKSSISFDALDFLRDWLKQHIMVVDMKYVPFVKK